MKASITWSTRREGNSGYVLETYPDGSSREFGPMPTQTVLPFVHARRIYQQRIADKLGLRKSPDEPDTMIS